jgi:hypothetical protein
MKMLGLQKAKGNKMLGNTSTLLATETVTPGNIVGGSSVEVAVAFPGISVGDIGFFSMGNYGGLIAAGIRCAAANIALLRFNNTDVTQVYPAIPCALAVIKASGTVTAL